MVWGYIWRKCKQLEPNPNARIITCHRGTLWNLHNPSDRNAAMVIKLRFLSIAELKAPLGVSARCAHHIVPSLTLLLLFYR
jgi:hypothetical protein